MMVPIDLHFHSCLSDGELTPEDVIERAAKRGAKLLALTDHDCTKGLERACSMALKWDVGFLNGVEISVSWNKRTIHIVGLGIDPTFPALEQGLQHVRAGRVERAENMAKALEKIGISGVLEGAMAYCQNPEMIGRTHFARYLIQQRKAKDVASVFRQYLVPGKPGYVPHHWALLEEAVQWINGSGGIAVIAHPGRYSIGSTLMNQLILDFKEYGGMGIEVVSSSHSNNDLYKFGLLAQRHQLLASVGSDFHAPGESWRDVGLTNPLPAGCAPVWERLAERIIAPAFLNDNINQ